jgi:hypothetical protein
MLFADLDLARRLEEAESFAAEAFVRAHLRRRPGADVIIEAISGGRAVFTGAGSPLTEVKGVGLHGPVTDADLDRMEAVFFSRGEPCRIVVCPLADASLVDGLGKRGYRIFGFENILAMPLDENVSDTTATPGIEIRPVGVEEIELYGRVVAPNFVQPGESTVDAEEMMATMIGMEHASSYLAWIDGQPVGGGSIFLRHGLALLAGAATLPQYRNRGVHAALHHARLAVARRSGCDLAAQGALAGSTSQRNAQRRGLQVAYTRTMMVRDPS